MLLSAPASVRALRCRIMPYWIKAAPAAPLARRQRRALPWKARPAHAGPQADRTSQINSDARRTRSALDHHSTLDAVSAASVEVGAVCSASVALGMVSAVSGI